MIHSTDETDVGVVSIADRRKIRDLENQIADLTAKLSAAQSSAVPMLKTSHSSCFHSGGFLVDDHRQEVVCASCEAAMDPYEVLRKIAHREVNFCYTLNGLRAEQKQLTKEVEALKAKRGRLRGQVAKATPDVPFRDIAQRMRELDADSFLVRQIGGTWGAWFHTMRSEIAHTSARRSMPEAVAEIMETTAKSDKDASG